MATRKMPQYPTLTIEDVRIIWRNFEGRRGRFNEEGVRSFGIELPNELARRMRNDGWNVKELKPREEGDPTTFAINIAVGFDFRPPQVFMVTPKARIRLTEDMIDVLDWADIETADVIIRGRIWDETNGPKIKAYLQKLFVTINEDELDRKYSINSE